MLQALNGCKTTPLMGYLKALGVFRTLAEQQDPDVHSFWSNNVFHIETKLTTGELVDFFVNTYKPTPIVTPWNGGSGFYPGDNVTELNKILQSSDQRLGEYADVIRDVKQWPVFNSMPKTFKDLCDWAHRLIGKLHKNEEISKMQAIINMCTGQNPPAPDTPIKSLGLTGNAKKGVTLIVSTWRERTKAVIQTESRMRLSDKVLAWFDASQILTSGGITMNPILGSGGNDGRSDFSQFFMAAVNFLVEHPSESGVLLQRALFGIGTALPSKLKIGLKSGMFDPAMAGGFNQSMKLDKEENFFTNPWDFVLMMEGALMFAGSVGKFSWTASQDKAQLPFVVNHFPAGFASNLGEEAPGAKELWVPVWERPAEIHELKALLREGRSTLGTKQAKNGFDFLKAVKSLGVDRGIKAFVRYAFLTRRGKSKVAMPVGSFVVEEQPAIRVLNEMENSNILNPAGRFLEKSVLTSGLGQTVKRMAFATAEKPDSDHFLGLLRAIGRFLKALSVLTPSDEWPRMNQWMSLDWLTMAGWQSRVEIRLAAAIVSIRQAKGVGPFIANLFHLNPEKPWEWSAERSQRFWYGSDLTERLANVFLRRLLDVEQGGSPFVGRLNVHASDVIAFLYGLTDDRLLEDLIWAFSQIRWNKGQVPEYIKDFYLPINRTYAILKLFYQPYYSRKNDLEPGKTGLKNGLQPAHLLVANRVSDAVNVARTGLLVRDLNPVNVSLSDPVLNGQRVAASLLVPVWNIRKLGDLVLIDDDNGK